MTKTDCHTEKWCRYSYSYSCNYFVTSKSTWREVTEKECQACKLNKEDVVDCSKWRKLIKDIRWSGYVWVGECFCWYWPTRVLPDQRPLNGCVCMCMGLLRKCRVDSDCEEHIKKSMYVNEQLKPAYTECRAAKGVCDLSEYCSGNDPVCPSDVYRRNTDSCTVDGVRHQSIAFFFCFYCIISDNLQCFDAVGWAAGRASGR